MATSTPDSATGIEKPDKKSFFARLGSGLLSLLLQVFLPYGRYCKYLKWLTPVLFTYVATVIYVAVRSHEPGLLREVTRGSFIPSLDLGGDSLKALIAVLGTTISPYLFFW